MLEIVELADEIRGRPTGERRDRCQTSQVRAVTAGTSDRRSVAACNERAAPLDTADRDYAMKTARESRLTKYSRFSGTSMIR